MIQAAKDSELNIRRVMSSDEGVYQCRADNAVGTVAGSVSLIVHGEQTSNSHSDKLIKWKIRNQSRHFNGTLEMIYGTPQIYDCHISRS